MSNVLDFQVNGVNPSSVGGLGGTVKYFPRPLPINGPGSALPTTPSSSSAAGALFLPAAAVYNGQQFDVIASGDYGSDTGDPSGTVTVQLYAVTGTLSSPTYTSIATTGAITPFYAYEPWALSASLMGVSEAGLANGLLLGSYQAAIRGSVTAPTTVTNIVTGLDFVNGNSALQRGAVLGFVIGVTFGTSNATNLARLYEFTIES